MQQHDGKMIWSFLVGESSVAFDLGGTVQAERLDDGRWRVVFESAPREDREDEMLEAVKKSPHVRWSQVIARLEPEA